MIDIHSHIEKENGVYLLEKLLADMDRFQIQKRVISDLRVDGIQEGIQQIAEAVKTYPARLIGCALLNPSLS